MPACQRQTQVWLHVIPRNEESAFKTLLRRNQTQTPNPHIHMPILYAEDLYHIQRSGSIPVGGSMSLMSRPIFLSYLLSYRLNNNRCLGIDVQEYQIYQLSIVAAFEKSLSGLTGWRQPHLAFSSAYLSRKTCEAAYHSFAY